MECIKHFSDMFVEVSNNYLQYQKRSYGVRTDEEMDQIKHLQYTVEKEEKWEDHRTGFPIKTFGNDKMGMWVGL